LAESGIRDFFAAASPRPYTSSITPLTTASTGTIPTAAESSIYEEFSFNGTFDLEVFIGMDDVPIRFLKILMTSRYPAAWKISKITPIAKTNTPCCPANYRPISYQRFPKAWK
jgi:hypothetical protein